MSTAEERRAAREALKRQQRAQALRANLKRRKSHAKEKTDALSTASPQASAAAETAAPADRA